MAKPKGKHLAPQSKGHAHKRTQKNARRLGLGKKIALGVGIALVVGAGSAYGAGVYYFSDHFLPNTTVNGKNVGLMSSAELAQVIDSEAKAYTQTVTVGDFTTTLTADQIGYSVDGQAAAQSAISQAAGRVWFWPVELFQTHAFIAENTCTFDQAKLDEAISQAVDTFNQDASSPENASVIYSEEQEAFIINPEVAGNVVNKDAITSSATDAARTQSQDAALDDSAIEKPQVTAEDPRLKTAVDTANAMLDTTVELAKGGNAQVEIDRGTKAGWVSVDDEYNVSVNQDKVSSYVSGVADKFASSDDEYTYLVKADELTQSITQALSDQTSATIEVPMRAKAKPKQVDSAMGSGTWDGSGSYLDVDLKAQYARLYDDAGGVVWESYIVSGNTSEGRNTPEGTFKLQGKSTDITLVGLDEDKDGKPDYESHVDYWMPFYAGSYGLHDATWRSKFGGSIYSYAGSHGCVNLPHDKAADLYSRLNVGDTIKIHS
ncbi:MAG: L,D-transpeptidase [Atopobiaceae bacterium]